MTMFRNLLSTKIFIISLLAANLVMVGCGSSGKSSGSNSATDETMMADSDSNAGDMSFEVNGDSDSGRAGGLRTVYFGFNSSQITSDARAKLEAAAEFLKENDTTQIQIEGHCDERGGVEYNLALGERRAKQVKQYLSTLGVSGSRISTVSYGKERPVAFGHDESAWSQNRRANFVIVAK